MDIGSPKFIPPNPHVPRIFFRGEKRPFSDGSDVRHSFETVASRLDRGIHAVAARVRVDPSSRVERWRRAISRLADANKRHVLEQIVGALQQGSWVHPFRDSFVAMGECRMFIEIVEQLGDYLTDRELRELVSGHFDPSLDQASARGRDKEFEWYIAAVLRRASLWVALAEPDVLIKYGDGIRSVAAKRLASRKQVDNNIKKASQQIYAAGYPGYIFLDLTGYMDPEAQFIEHWRHNGDAVRSRLNAFARKPAVTHRRNELVNGVFLRASFPLASPGFVYGTSEMLMGVGVQGGDRDEHIDLTRTLLTGMLGV